MPTRLSMWDNGAMSALWVWIKAVFVHRRRWLAVTAPTLIVPYVANYLLGLPKSLSLAALILGPPWWLWAIGFLAGTCLAGYFAWLEQFNQMREITGMPEVTLKTVALQEPFRFEFQLENASSRVAVNLTANAIDIPIPKGYLVGYKARAEKVGHPAPDKWSILFPMLEKVGEKDSAQVLKPQIYWPSSPEEENLIHILNVVSGFRSDIPLTVVFSSIGEPQRKWHSHYRLQYWPLEGAMSAFHESVGEVPRGKTHCSRCAKKRFWSR